MSGALLEACTEASSRAQLALASPPSHLLPRPRPSPLQPYLLEHLLGPAGLQRAVLGSRQPATRQGASPGAETSTSRALLGPSPFPEAKAQGFPQSALRKEVPVSGLLPRPPGTTAWEACTSIEPPRAPRDSGGQGLWGAHEGRTTGRSPRGEGQEWRTEGLLLPQAQGHLLPRRGMGRECSLVLTPAKALAKWQPGLRPPQERLSPASGEAGHGEPDR